MSNDKFKDVTKYVEQPTSNWKCWTTEKFWKTLIDFPYTPADDEIRDRFFIIIKNSVQKSRNLNQDNSVQVINYEYTPDWSIVPYNFQKIAYLDKYEYICKMADE